MDEPSLEDIETISNLLILADEFLITRLREISECLLVKHITLKTVIQLLTFANTYNASILKDDCMQFICLNLSCVIENRQLENVDEDLLNELTEYYCKWNPVMSQRVITPYSDAVDDQTVAQIHSAWPVSLEEKHHCDVEIKARRKTKSRSQRLSSCSEEIKTKRSEDAATTLHGSESETQYENKGEISVTSSRLQAIKTAYDKVTNEILEDDYTSLKIDQFPELNSNCVLSRSPGKIEKFDKHRMNKLSQKQRKRLSSESSVKDNNELVLAGRPFKQPQFAH